MYPAEVAAERIRRALATAKAIGVPDFTINARTDILVHGGELSEVIERGKAYLAAGATLSLSGWHCTWWNLGK